jgi:uncharacterized membrane protein YbhN (UPF0104 family)
VRGRWSGALGIGVSLLLLWWVLHDVDPGEVWAELRGARWGWLLLMVATATLTFPLRTVRWRVLLRLEGASLPWTPLWHATAIGFMANNLLPARAGEVARAYAVRQLSGVPFGTAVASIAVERVFDGLTIVALLLLGVAAGGFAGTGTIGGVPVSRVALSMGLLFAAALAAALLVVAWPAWWLALAQRMALRWLPERWAGRAVGFFRGLIDGLSALRAPGRVAAVVAWSVVLWLVNAASFGLAFLAFRVAVPPGAALVLQGLVAFGVALPSSPGFFGIFEAATRVALALYGVAETPAVSVAIGYHVGGFIPITALGLWSLARAGLHFRNLRAEQKDL